MTARRRPVEEGGAGSQGAVRPLRLGDEGEGEGEGELPRGELAPSPTQGTSSPPVLRDNPGVGEGGWVRRMERLRRRLRARNGNV